MENRPTPDVDRLSVMLVVTPVIGGGRAMRWTSPLSGSCFTLDETGGFEVSRRTAEGRETALAGVVDRVAAETCLDAPQGLEARCVAARALVDVDGRHAERLPAAS